MKWVVLLGLLYLVCTVHAKPWRRSDDNNDDDDDDGADWEGAIGRWSEDDIRKFLESVPVGEIRAKAAKFKADLQEALDVVRQLEAVAEPLSADFQLDPAFAAAGSKLGIDEENIAMDMAKLPPLPADKDLHFLDNCIEVAKSTDFDQFTEVHLFLNEVIRQVVVCAGSGLEVMVDAVDLDTLEDSEVTVDEVIDRLTRLRQAGLEMGHLGKFVMEFFFRVYTGGLEGGLTNNELVHGKDDKDRKGPKPGPSDDGKDKDKMGPRPGPSGDGRNSDKKGPRKGGPGKDEENLDPSPGLRENEEDEDGMRPTGPPGEKREVLEQLLNRMLSQKRVKAGNRGLGNDVDKESDDVGLAKDVERELFARILKNAH